MNRLCDYTDEPKIGASAQDGFLMPPSLAPVSQEPLAKSDAQLVAEACGRAAQALGLTRDELSAVVGKHRTSIERTGLDPKTKEGDSWH